MQVKTMFTECVFQGSSIFKSTIKPEVFKKQLSDF
jgi:hypothetical protein